ncbi:MAG TPA: efflux transporter outer membrane subunit [Ramlibacter sp.]|nr:efflux transporter outer membrane subunit [Ramlibacter sp.]
MRAISRWALGPVAAAVLAGCSFIPTDERPALPTPASFPGTAAAPVAAPLPGWQAFFTDERLRQLIATALRNNRDLRVAVLNIEQARAQFGLREADLLPTVGVGASASRARGATGNGLSTTYTAGLLVSSWEIDFFGRLASLSEAARAQVLASEEARKATQVTLVSSVATAWLNLAADEELLALTRQTLATRDESLRLVQLRFDNGASSELDLRQAQSLAESARVTLAQLQRQRMLDLNALGLLLGEPLPDAFSVGVTTASVSLPDLPPGVPSDVLVARPDVLQAEQQLVSANASIGAARAAFFPRISLTAGIGTASSELTGLFKGGSWGLTATPQLLAPIFDAGRNESGLRSAKVTREIAVSQYERAIQTAFREVSDALAGRATLGEQLRSQTAVTEAEAVRLRLSQMRFDAGVSSTLDVLDAQRTAFAAQQAQIQTRLLLLQNQVAMYRALGGGWSDATQAAAARP